MCLQKEPFILYSTVHVPTLNDNTETIPSLYTRLYVCLVSRKCWCPCVAHKSSQQQNVKLINSVRGNNPLCPLIWKDAGKSLFDAPRVIKHVDTSSRGWSIVGQERPACYAIRTETLDTWACCINCPHGWASSGHKVVKSLLWCPFNGSYIVGSFGCNSHCNMSILLNLNILNYNALICSHIQKSSNFSQFMTAFSADLYDKLFLGLHILCVFFHLRRECLQNLITVTSEEFHDCIDSMKKALSCPVLSKMATVVRCN